MYKKCCDGVEKICLNFSIALLVIVVLLTFTETVLRYCFHSSLKYTQELVTYAMPWISFVGGAAAWRRGALVNINVLGKAPKTVRIVCSLVCEALILALLVLTVRSGIVYAVRNVGQLSPAMQISTAWCYASVPVGCFLMAFFSVEKAVKSFFVKSGEEGQK